VIRPVDRNDLPEIVDLFRELWPDLSLTLKDVEPILERYLRDNSYEIFCFEDKKILGVITLSKRWAFFYRSRVALIEDIVVREKYRNQGIGKKLVQFVESRLTEQGIKCVELASDFHRTKTHEFWESLNYRRLAFQFRKDLL